MIEYRGEVTQEHVATIEDYNLYVTIRCSYDEDFKKLIETNDYINSKESK